MAFRTVTVKNNCKLEYSLGFMIYRTADQIKKIHLDEIECVIIQSTGVAITSALISALIEHKIKVIFCDAKANPQSELMPYYNNYCTYKKIMAQISFDDVCKDKIWQAIIYEKIKNEYRLLKLLECYASVDKLEQYLQEITLGDMTNREGHAAKVYFNSLFGNSFSRDDDSNSINKYLNYGYSIIVSCINREIKALGFLTELGIHHKGETNAFNLSYDLVEPLRTLIDSFVVLNKVNDENFKDIFQRILSLEVDFDGKRMFLDNAIHNYILSIFNALSNNDVQELKFINYEL